jgi:hypothetical protein
MTRRKVHYVVAQAAKSARIPFPVHPHMLRHGTGFYLVNQGHDTRAVQLYLGTKTFSARCATRSLPPVDSKTFGEIDPLRARPGCQTCARPRLSGWSRASTLHGRRAGEMLAPRDDSPLVPIRRGRLLRLTTRSR